MKCCLLCMSYLLSFVLQLESEPEVVQIGKTPENVPFLIPKKWKWGKINDFAQIVRGGSPRPIKSYLTSQENGINWIKISDAERGTTRITNCAEKIIPEGIKKSRFIKKGSLLLTNSMSYGYPYILDVDGCIHDGWLAFSNFELHMDRDFLYYVLLSPYCRSMFNNKAAGAVVKNLNIDKVKTIFIPAPPLEEQYRIVTKINQLFEQIDRAEKAYNELSGPLSERFRQLCLEKAIQGKLVPQLESEPEVEQVGDAPEDVPFEIPEKWRWMQLNKVGKIVGGGTPKTSLSEYWDGGTIPWFTPADLGKVHGLYASDSARKITALGLKESSAVMMPPNSVLFSSRAPIGHIALAADSCCTNQGCKSFVPNVGIVLPLWGYFAMKARTPDMIARASGTTFKEISGKGVGETLVPIPPLEEQRRIVTKLSEILNVVRQLENSVLIS